MFNESRIEIDFWLLTARILCAHNMHMENPTYPAPDIALKETAPATRFIYKALEAAVVVAKEYFDNLDKEVDPFLAADLVRYHAVLYMDKKGSEVEGFDRKPLPNNGLCVHFGNYRIRVRKSDEGDIPDPGPSRTMQAFYQQRLEGWDQIADDDGSALVNVLIIWDATRNYVLLGMKLVCPKDGSESRRSAEKYWEIAIPHPASTLRPAQPKPNTPTASTAEDLPYIRKRPAQTGTENADG